MPPPRLAGRLLRMTGLVGSAWLGLACGPSPEPLPEIRNVILISIDTLRADHLASYGHPYVRTPHLDALAREGFLFESHITAAPTTLASHTSLMTGTWPHRHGIPRNGFVVDPENRMLAEILSDHGFTSAGFIGAYPLTRRFAFDQGFAHWDETLTIDRSENRGIIDQSQRPANEVTDAVLGWIDERPGESEERLFLFVHYFDVHAPYVPPKEFADLYRKDSSALTGSFVDIKRVRRELARGRGQRMQDALARVYAAGVTWVDSEVGRLIAGLEARGVLDGAIVIVTSDHGEVMNRKAERWDHGRTTYDEATRVPLIVRLPAGHSGGERISDLVSNVDVLPSLLALLGIPEPEGVQGRSFAHVFVNEPRAAVRKQTYSEATKPHDPAHESDSHWINSRKDRAIRTKDWKLIHHPISGEVELFDLRRDPGETSSLAQEEAERASRLLESLNEWNRSADPRASTRDISPEVREHLEALGYVE